MVKEKAKGTERNEFDEKIELYVGKTMELVALGVKNLALSVPYGIIQAKNYHKSDIGILISSLAAPVTLYNYNLINLVYTPVAYATMALSVRGFKFIAQKWRFNKAIRECQIMSNNNKYPKLKSIRYEGKRKTFVISSTVGPSQFKIHAQKIKSTSNICLTDIEQQNKKILLHTERKAKLKEEYQEIARFLEVFESLELPVVIKDYESTEYFINVYFNTEIYYNKLQTIIPELIHRLKVKTLEITTGIKYNYKLTVRKEIKKKLTFLVAWDSIEVQERIKDMIIPILIGINCDTGEIALYDMANDMYHVLVAGTTGWGKSVLIQNICSSILLANKPNIRCYFFDTKGTELNLYEGLNNVYFEKDLNRIVTGLEKLVDEMNSRNDKIYKANRFINNIYGWNENYPDKQFDFIVIIVEEISFFMESSDLKLKNRFESAIIKISQLGRSAGMQLIISTQNPVASVITGEIKSNVETKAGHKTANKTKSRTILDNNMCADIDEKGKYVFQNKGSDILHKSFFIQESESKTIYYRIKAYETKKHEELETLEMTNDLAIEPSVLGTNPIKPIENHYNLYLFYINIQGSEGKLPIRKEIMKQTGLTEWKLNQMDKQLRIEGKIINKGNDRIVVTEVDELRQRRRAKDDGD